MRKSKQLWLEAGLQTLGKVGARALTIERLTEELGVTKGSFYHHFRNAEDFQEQLIAFWADQYFSTSSSVPDDPEELLSLLDDIMHEVFEAITEPEIAIRVWAHQNDMVRSFVERIDATRHEFVRKVFQSVVGDEKQGRLMADIFSAILLGSMTALPRIQPDRVLELYEEFKRLYGI